MDLTDESLIILKLNLLKSNIQCKDSNDDLVKTSDSESFDKYIPKTNNQIVDIISIESLLLMALKKKNNTISILNRSIIKKIMCFFLNGYNITYDTKFFSHRLSLFETNITTTLYLDQYKDMKKGDFVIHHKGIDIKYKFSKIIFSLINNNLGYLKHINLKDNKLFVCKTKSHLESIHESIKDFIYSIVEERITIKNIQKTNYLR